MERFRSSRTLLLTYMAKVPKFLKRLHEDFVRALPYLESASVLVPADDQTPEELAALMVDAVLAR